MSNVNRQTVAVQIDTATAHERGFRAPFDGKIMSVACSVNTAITVATATLTAEIDGTAVTGVSFAITTARAVGYQEVSYPTAAYTFRKGQYISAVSDGGGDAGNCTVTFDLQQD